MSFNFINPTVIERTKIDTQPFTWGHFNHLIFEDQQLNLFKEYPQENFLPVSRLAGDKKNYRFHVQKLILHNMKQPSYFQLSPLWQAFIEEIASDLYLQKVFLLLDIKAPHYHLDIGLFRFHEGDWVESHVDHQDKLLTQLFYFNDEWLLKWGGLLLLHHGPNPDQVFRYFPPCISHSIAFKRCNNAWHSVTPVTCNAESHRLTLQIEVWQ